MPIILDKVSHIYGEDTAMAVRALDNISLVIPRRTIYWFDWSYWLWQIDLGAASERADEGHFGAVYFNGEDIDSEGFDKKKLRSKVGLVFQYPEHQLFETDVFSDVCFAPKT